MCEVPLDQGATGPQLLSYINLPRPDYNVLYHVLAVSCSGCFAFVHAVVQRVATCCTARRTLLSHTQVTVAGSKGRGGDDGASEHLWHHLCKPCCTRNSVIGLYKLADWLRRSFAAEVVRPPHGHRTVTAQSPHGHRTVTAQSPPWNQRVFSELFKNES